MGFEYKVIKRRHRFMSDEWYAKKNIFEECLTFFNFTILPLLFVFRLHKRRTHMRICIT